MIPSHPVSPGQKSKTTATVALLCAIVLFACSQSALDGDAPVEESIPATTQAATVSDDLCATWSDAVEVGELDPAVFEEGSGLDFSHQFPERLYHISDGDDSRLYVSDLSGVVTQTVEIAGFRGSDVEDLTVGRCADGSWCIFIADVGDNSERRPWAEIVVVAEVDDFGGAVEPIDRIRFRYPDGSNDAEAVAIHPNGDIFIMARKWSFSPRQIRPTPIFRLPSERWSRHGDEVLVAERVGTIDFTRLGALRFPDGVATALDIGADGKSLLVLNYLGAFELTLDLESLSKGSAIDTATLSAGVDYQRIDLTPLEQQEAAAWVPGQRAFVYGTEFATRAFSGTTPSGRARLMKVECSAHSTD